MTFSVEGLHTLVNLENRKTNGSLDRRFSLDYKEKIEVYLGSGERAVQAVEQDDAEPYLSSVGFAFSAVEEDERHQDIISSVPPHVEPIPQKQSRQRKRALEGTE